jgi:hypothetical protein
VPVPSELAAWLDNAWDAAMTLPPSRRRVGRRVQWNKFEFKITLDLSADKQIGDDVLSVKIRNILG